MAVTSKLGSLLKKFLRPSQNKSAPVSPVTEDKSLQLAIRNLGGELDQALVSHSQRSDAPKTPQDELEWMRQRLSHQRMSQTKAPVASVLMTAQACEVIDQEMIRRICQYDDGTHGDTLTELIRLFLELTPKRIESLKRALKDRSWHCVSKEAHSLKASSANLGLKRVTIACRKLEAIENHPDYSMASTLLSEIEK